ncbi:uncharacterized protein DNG_01656 [Cephalotrichum gorgonifer]|uniref:Uncharacterized protein n=1 Tax=Cephalotrichum gorgonifer TaxID=2041049 RepID=A0AAE8MRA6_9PEZI|nr:uncharacterized protein DNG_01656 [Cephalotrichum gorgonifer]
MSKGTGSPSFEVIHDQPTWARAPYAAAERNPRTRTPTSLLEKPAPVRTGFASSLRDFSVRSLRARKTRAASSSTSRRPRISSPTDFRHIYSHPNHFSADAFEYSAPTTGQHPPFHPLQVGVGRNLSPILPYFESAGMAATPPPPASRFGEVRDDDDDVFRVVTPPPAARLREARDGEGFNLRRSHSSLSFHVPRRPVTAYSHPNTSPKNSPHEVRTGSPQPPPVPPKSRARANTAPEVVDHLKERIAEALLEKERLQEMIDDVVERQSIYLGSRPSTAHSLATHVPSRADPLPAIPALPSSAPSFAERLNPDLRRQPQTPTVPPAPTQLPPPENNASFPELVPRPLQVLPFQGPPTPPRSRGAEDAPLQPPLPLVLRPPLRKKKSFSRVSTWLFPSGSAHQRHQRGLSIDSITNVPRPIRDADGFYQCAVSPPVTAESRRMSGESVSSVSTWESEEETAPTTTFSGPGSSPPARHGASHQVESDSVFAEARPKREVGVAF